MSDFQILVDAIIDVNKIKEQLSEKLKNVTIKPTISKTTLNKDINEIVAKVDSGLAKKPATIKINIDDKNIEKDVVKKVKSLNNIIKSRENAIRIQFAFGDQENITKAINKAQREALAAQKEMYRIIEQGGQPTDKNYLAWENYYKRLLTMSTQYNNKLMANEKTSASKVAKSIEEQYRNKTMSYENAIENLKRINAEYSQDYTAAMNVIGSGKHFSDLTDEQRRAVAVTQENEAAMKRLTTEFNRSKSSASDFVKVLSQFISTRFIVYKVWQEFKQGLEVLREIDDALVNIRKVTDMTADSATALARRASEEVSAFGRTVQDYLSAYEMFAKAGFRDTQLTGLTELSLLLQNVGDVTADTANETLIAANAGFKLNGNYEKLAHTIDAMNNVSNNNATTIGKMSDAIKMSANVADTAGFSIDQFIAIIGTATAATQREGSEIGRAVRTIVANIRQIKDAEAEVDEDSFAKAGLALKNIAGISITMNGELRDTMDVLTELAGKWGTLDSIQKQQLATDLANKRQMDVFLGLMDNWTMVEKQLGEAVNSTGSALEENAIYTESITAKVNEFNNAVTKMWQDTIETDAMKSFISFGTGFIDFINKLGLANVALTLTLAALSNKTSLIHKGFVALITPLKEVIKSVGAFASATAKGMKNHNGLIESLKNGKAAAANTGAGFSSLAGIIATVLVFAITQFIQKSKEGNAELERLAETAIESANTFRDSQVEINSLINEYDKLSKTKGRTIDEDNRLIEVANLLKTKYEESADAINAVRTEQEKLPLFIDTTTGAFINNTSAIEDNIEALRTLSIEQAGQLVSTNQTAVQMAEAFFSSFSDYENYLGPVKTFSNDIVKEAARASNILYGINTPEARDRGNDFKLILEDINKELEKNLETNHLSKKELKDLESAQKLLSEEIEKHNKIIEENIRLKALSGITEPISEAEIRRVSAMENRMEGLNRATAHASSATEDLTEDLAAAEEEARKISETFDNASSNSLMLADAYYTVANNQQLNSKQISELLNKYPQLLQYYDANTNTLNINASAIDVLINKELNLAKTTATASSDRLKAIIDTSNGALNAYKKQIEAMQVLSKTESRQMGNTIFSQKYAEVYKATGNWSKAVKSASQAQRDFNKDVESYHADIAKITGLQAQLGSTKTYGTTSPNFEKIAKDTSSSASSSASEAERAQDEAQKRLLDNTEARFELIRIAISNAYEQGAISAKVALARINKEINSIKGTYNAIKSKAENTWTDVEKLTVSHYENLLSMQKDYSAEVQKAYDDAVSAVESMQAKLVSAIRTKYEEEKSAAIKAIEAQRTARQKAFDERIAQLEAEKAAMQSTEQQDQANLKTLEKKLEMSRLDDSVLGKKRTAELQAEVNELRKNLQIAAIDKEIAKVKESAEASNQTYDEKIAKAEEYYEKLLSEANLYNEANKLLLSNNMNAIVNLLKQYEPTFSGIGQLLGGSMAKEITAEVNKALDSIKTVKSGVSVPNISYKPSSPSIVASAPKPTPAPAPKPTTSAIPYPNTVFVRGSAGETVKRIQRNLVAKGYSVGSAGIDGKYGPATEAAVRAFQSKYGLGIDGKVGPQTWPKLVTFKSGGVPVLSGGSMTKGEGLAMVHDKERILTEHQTKTFDDMIYKYFPKLIAQFERVENGGNSFNSELVKIINNINNNTPYDVDRNNNILVSQIRNTLASQGFR